MDLLYPNTTYVHASHFTDEELALVRDSGGMLFAQQIEIQMGHGWAPAVTALEYNIPIGLSSDVATTASPTSSPRCMRSSAQNGAASTRPRGRRPRRTEGLFRADHIPAGAALGDARWCGGRPIANRTGSITPGKKADLVIIDTKAVNVAPVIDPVGAVVRAADISNVKTVLVDGAILKEDFQLKADLDAPRRAVEASRDYLIAPGDEPDGMDRRVAHVGQPMGGRRVKRDGVTGLEAVFAEPDAHRTAHR